MVQRIVPQPFGVVMGVRGLKTSVFVPLLAWCLATVAVVAISGVLSAPVAGQSVRSLVLTTTKARPVDVPVPVRDVVIADPEVVAVVAQTRRRVFLVGRTVGITNAFFIDDAGNQVLELDIEVRQDLTGVRRALADLVPNADVRVRAVNDTVVISGDVPSADVAENVRQVVARFMDDPDRVINQVRITSQQQVLIRVRIAELNRTALKTIGVNIFFQDGRFVYQSGTGPSLNPSIDRFATSATVGGPFGLTNPLNSATPFSPLGTQQITGMIEALEQQQLVKTLAEPNLTAISGEPASFLAGGEFPVPTGRDINGRVQIEFKPFGVGLTFTPVVLSSGRISLRLSTEVSDLSATGAVVLDDFEIPSLRVRRATTAVEIPSGGTLVLAGLLQDITEQTIRSYPGLGSLPILGALFRSPSFQRDETELVVIATPYLVTPTRPQAITLPTDGFGPASDIDLYLLGTLYSRYGRPENAPSPGGDAPIGYILEP